MSSKKYDMIELLDGDNFYQLSIPKTFLLIYPSWIIHCIALILQDNSHEVAFFKIDENYYFLKSCGDLYQAVKKLGYNFIGFKDGVLCIAKYDQDGFENFPKTITLDDSSKITYDLVYPPN